MPKQMTKWGLLFFVCGCSAYNAYLEDQMPMADPMSSMLMYGMMGDKNMTLAEGVDRGIKFGIVRGVSGLTGRALEATLSGGISRVSTAFGAAKKAVMQSIYGNNKGFDVREIFAWRAVLESSVSTHILNVAKGARVVRAHVLSKDAETKPAEPQALHGVQVLKQDMVYMVSKLNEYEPYYTVKANGTRSALDRVLDIVALAGAGYVVGDCFVRQAKEKDIVADIDYWQKILLEKQAQGLKLAAAFQNPSEQMMHTIVNMVNAQAHAQGVNEIAAERVAHYTAQLREVSIQSGNHTKFWIKGALSAFALVRLVQWLRSNEAVKAANMLSDVNRDLVVHMIGALRSNLQHLISLCDGVKDESDLVRVKDDFEFISKNCGDSLLQIAYLIDQDETLKMQKLGKPGATQGAYNQGLAGFGAGLPKL